MANRTILTISMLILLPISALKADNLTGNYLFEFENGGNCLLEILQWESSLIEFQINCLRDTTSYNQGIVHDTVRLINSKGKYIVKDNPENTNSCIINIEFNKDKARINQIGSSSSCGFGGNVYCTGEYKKTNSNQPKFIDINGESLKIPRKSIKQKPRQE
jgi:hypothetical protein